MTRLLCSLLLLFVLPSAAPLAQPAREGAREVELDRRIAAAYRAAYNLDHQAALSTAREAIAFAPDASRAHRTLASILWLQALFHRGAVTVDHYMGGLTRSEIDMPDPPAAIADEFHKALARATELAEAAYERAPSSVDALHDMGAAYGLDASWVASVEGSVRAAFSRARRAFDAEEEVLERAPSRVGAGAIVGTYRYAVAGLGLATRLVAYLAGFGGGKAQGIALLEAAAGPGSESRFEARTALVLIYSRESRHQDAWRLLTEMSAEFPANRILVLEQGAAAIRAGQAREAETILTGGIEQLATDNRRRLPGERALWFYRRGLARFDQGNDAGAADDLEEALRSAPEPWVRGRIQLALGKVADVAGRRGDALAKYRIARTDARESRDARGLEEANLLIRRPFLRPQYR